MSRSIQAGDRVKLVGSTSFKDQIRPVVGVNKDGWGNVVSLDVDVGHPDGKPNAYPPRDVELVEEES